MIAMRGWITLSNFKLIETGIEGLVIIEPTVSGDNRGYFMETYNKKDFEAIGLKVNFVQDNQSSSRKGVLRGLHRQVLHPQGKLVRVLRGSVYDVGIDVRKDSPTYGKWYGIVLSEENKRIFYVPEDFLHGFLVLSEEAEFTYKCTDFYHPEDEDGIIWNDPDLNITWPLEEVDEIILSPKDRNLRKFKML